MEVIFRISGKVLISCIRGDVDHHSALPLRQAIDKSMKAFDCSDLVMDFSGVDFMDSSGIGLILGRSRSVRAVGGELLIKNARREIAEVIRISGLGSLIAAQSAV